MQVLNVSGSGVTAARVWQFGAVPLPTSTCTCKQSQAIARGVGSRGRANSAHIRQSRPDSGLAFQVKVLKPFKNVPSLLERVMQSAAHYFADDIGVSHPTVGSP